jgi:hypothetical protein
MAKLSIAAYNAATPEERSIQDCADMMYEELGRGEEHAYDGEELPTAWKARVYREVADRAIAFAEYLEKNP